MKIIYSLSKKDFNIALNNKFELPYSFILIIVGIVF